MSHEQQDTSKISVLSSEEWKTDYKKLWYNPLVWYRIGVESPAIIYLNLVNLEELEEGLKKTKNRKAGYFLPRFLQQELSCFLSICLDIVKQVKTPGLQWYSENCFEAKSE